MEPSTALTIAVVTASILSIVAIFIAADTVDADDHDFLEERVRLLERQVNVLISDVQKLCEGQDQIVRVLGTKVEQDARWSTRMGGAMIQLIEAVQLTTTDLRIDFDMLDLQVRGERALEGFDDPRRDT